MGFETPSPHINVSSHLSVFYFDGVINNQWRIAGLVESGYWHVSNYEHNKIRPSPNTFSITVTHLIWCEYEKNTKQNRPTTLKENLFMNLIRIYRNCGSVAHSFCKVRWKTMHFFGSGFVNNLPAVLSDEMREMRGQEATVSKWETPQGNRRRPPSAAGIHKSRSRGIAF